MQSRNFFYPGAQGVVVPEGSSAARAIKVEWAVQPAGWLTTARAQEDGPVIWEALSVLRESDTSVGRSQQGEPKLGHEAVLGVGGPNRSDDLGERWHSDPSEQRRPVLM